MSWLFFLIMSWYDIMTKPAYKRTFNWAFSFRELNSMIVKQRHSGRNSWGLTSSPINRKQRKTHWEWQDSFELSKPVPMTCFNKVIPPNPTPPPQTIPATGDQDHRSFSFGTDEGNAILTWSFTLVLFCACTGAFQRLTPWTVMSVLVTHAGLPTTPIMA